MKLSWIASFVFVVLLASVAQAQAFPLRGVPIGPEGQQSVGKYIFVWKSASVTTLKVTEIEAVCPSGYVVVAGGYQGTIGSFWGGFNLWASEPSPKFGGWVIEAIGSTQHRTTMMTVYATCAPISN
jgi:hypothetical protein